MTVVSHCQTELHSQLGVKGFLFFLTTAAPQGIYITNLFLIMVITNRWFHLQTQVFLFATLGIS